VEQLHRGSKILKRVWHSFNFSHVTGISTPHVRKEKRKNIHANARGQGDVRGSLRSTWPEAARGQSMWPELVGGGALEAQLDAHGRGSGRRSWSG
jgi:hypothetical protein